MVRFNEGIGRLFPVMDHDAITDDSSIADIYIHTPSRINAIAFIVSLATMLSKTMDVVLEEARPRGRGRGR